MKSIEMLIALLSDKESNKKLLAEFKEYSEEYNSGNTLERKLSKNLNDWLSKFYKAVNTDLETTIHADDDFELVEKKLLTKFTDQHFHDCDQRLLDIVNTVSTVIFALNTARDNGFVSNLDGAHNALSSLELRLNQFYNAIDTVFYNRTLAIQIENMTGYIPSDIFANKLKLVKNVLSFFKTIVFHNKALTLDSSPITAKHTAKHKDIVDDLNKELILKEPTCAVSSAASNLIPSKADASKGNINTIIFSDAYISVQRIKKIAAIFIEQFATIENGEIEPDVNKVEKLPFHKIVTMLSEIKKTLICITQSKNTNNQINLISISQWIRRCNVLILSWKNLIISTINTAFNTQSFLILSMLNSEQEKKIAGKFRDQMFKIENILSLAYQKLNNTPPQKKQEKTIELIKELQADFERNIEKKLSEGLNKILKELERHKNHLSLKKIIQEMMKSDSSENNEVNYAQLQCDAESLQKKIKEQDAELATPYKTPVYLANMGSREVNTIYKELTSGIEQISFHSQEFKDGSSFRSLFYSLTEIVTVIKSIAAFFNGEKMLAIANIVELLTGFNDEAANDSVTRQIDYSDKVTSLRYKITENWIEIVSEEIVKILESLNDRVNVLDEFSKENQDNMNLLVGTVNALEDELNALIMLSLEIDPRQVNKLILSNEYPAFPLPTSSPKPVLSHNQSFSSSSSYMLISSNVNQERKCANEITDSDERSPLLSEATFPPARVRSQTTAVCSSKVLPPPLPRRISQSDLNHGKKPPSNPGFIEKLNALLANKHPKETPPPVSGISNKP